MHQVKLGELEAELLEINANNEKLQRSYSELLEYKLVLQKVWIVFSVFLLGFKSIFSLLSRFKSIFITTDVQ